MTKVSGEITTALLGTGRMAARVLDVLGALGRPVRLWGRSQDEATKLAEGRARVEVAGSVAEACGPADMIFMAVPAAAVREVADSFGAVARGDHVVLHASRGVAPGFLLPHQAIRAVTCVKKIGVLGGPLYFDDLKSGHPLAAVVGARYGDVAAQLRALTAGGPVRLHPTTDITGVEIAGAISNVSALAAGMADELGMGETARGVLLTHGLEDASRIGRALGAEARTFTGLAGVGDLIPRRVSSTERHHQVGALLAKGRSLQEALGTVEGCVEGVATTCEAVELAARRGFELPMVGAVEDVLEGRRPAAEALDDVLRRDFVLGRLSA
jgi:glycerol-3-phosphate dehydrogenase (NAD(P)+)